MKKNIFFYSLFIIINIYSCQKNKEDNTSITPSKDTYDDFYNNNKIKALSKKILFEQDITAYNSLERIYLESGHSKDFLFYSLRMAEDSNYAEASFTTYFILHSNDEKDIKINKLAIYYLIKAYELGSDSAILEITEFFENGKIPKSKDYWNAIN